MAATLAFSSTRPLIRPYYYNRLSSFGTINSYSISTVSNARLRQVSVIHHVAILVMRYNNPASDLCAD